MRSSEHGCPGRAPHHWARPGWRARSDRGFVTAEAAVAVPALVVFALAMIWGLMAASAQIRCVDAARAGARAAARSEPRAVAVAAARSAAPEGARITLGRTGDLWRVRVEAPSPGPGSLSLTLTAEAAASAEDAVPEDAAAGDAVRETTMPESRKAGDTVRGDPAGGEVATADTGGLRPGEALW